MRGDGRLQHSCAINKKVRVKRVTDEEPVKRDLIDVFSNVLDVFQS